MSDPGELPGAVGAHVHPPLDVAPLTDACSDIMDRGEHALIGVSPGNSYFTQERLGVLLNWAVRRFGSVDVVYTDLHLDSMHLAAGATPEHARSRARRSVRDTRRRIHRAHERLRPDAPVRVRALSECVRLSGYQTVHSHLERARAANSRLARACEDQARAFVSKRDGTGSPDGSEAALQRAALDYLTAELPLLANTPHVLGVPSSVCCYHMVLPVLHELRRAQECWHPAQAHAVVRTKDEARSPDAHA